MPVFSKNKIRRVKPSKKRVGTLICVFKKVPLATLFLEGFLLIDLYKGVIYDLNLL